MSDIRYLTRYSLAWATGRRPYKECQRFLISEFGRVPPTCPPSFWRKAGRDRAVLVNERKEPGQYVVTFDASGLASGTYLYRLTSTSFVQTRKMTLVR